MLPYKSPISSYSEKNMFTYIHRYKLFLPIRDDRSSYLKLDDDKVANG